MSYAATNKLELKNLEGVVGNKQLFDGLSAFVSAGQLLRIVGENGAGKSTLLRIITGLLTAEAGSIEWNGTSVSDDEAFAQSMCFIGHKDGLKAERTALENLSFYQDLYQSNAVNLDQLLLDYDLLQCADVLTKQLSFGQRRRLALLRLVIANRPLWVLDEPFTGIDIQARVLIEQLFEQHLQAGGMIVMTHHGSLNNSSIAQYEKQIAL
jgi:heme exporter protein A